MLSFTIFKNQIVKALITKGFFKVPFVIFFAQFKKIVAFSNLIQRIYHNDIRNMLP